MSSKQNAIVKTQRRTSRRKQTKLLFPAYRVRRFLHDGNYTKRIGRNAPAALAAVLEYLMIEILGLSGRIAKKFKSKRIQPRHLLLAIRLDDELNELLQHVIVAQGGVLPNIPKRRKSKKM